MDSNITCREVTDNAKKEVMPSPPHTFLHKGVTSKLTIVQLPFSIQGLKVSTTVSGGINVWTMTKAMEECKFLKLKLVMMK